MAGYTQFPAFTSSGSAPTSQMGGPSRSDTAESFPFNRTSFTPQTTPPTTYADTAHRGQTDAAYAYAATDRAAQQPLTLTLGVEFEMLLAQFIYPQRNSEYLLQSGREGVNSVRHVLRQPIKATCSTCKQPHMFYLPVATEDHLHGYGKWDVESDCSIDLTDAERNALMPNGEYFAFYAIEIKTRVLSVDEPLITTPSRANPGHVHSISYAEEIRSVLDHLHANFNAPAAHPEYRLITNRRCGMHVHMGNGKTTLQTVKNMLSTYTACEPAIDSMMAADRIGGSNAAITSPGGVYCNPRTGPFPQEGGADATPYNSSLFSLHAAATYMNQEVRDQGFSSDSTTYPANRFVADPFVYTAAHEYSLAAAITLIQHAPDVLSLRQLQKEYSHACTVNVEHVYDFLSQSSQAVRSRNTVEFRQHAATLDPTEVLPWVDFLVRLTQHSHSTSAEQYNALMRGDFSRLDFTAIDLLETLGAKAETTAYYMLKLGAPWSIDHIATSMSTGVDPIDPFKNQKYAESDLALNTIVGNHPMKPLLIENCRGNLYQMERENINKRMLLKFMSGGYGQFLDQQLASLDFRFMGEQADEAMQKLRVGYRNPVRATPQVYEPYRPNQAPAWNVPTPNYRSDVESEMDPDMVALAEMTQRSPESMQAISPSSSDWNPENETAPVSGGFIPICLDRRQV